MAEPSISHKGALCDLTAEAAREILNYDPETGDFRWKVATGRRCKLGDVAGWVNRERRTVRRKIAVNGNSYMAHRLAWLYMTGQWPEHEVDHINGDGTDNKWANLRSATSSQNLRNRGPQANNKTGFKGVCFDNTRGKFIATIKLHGKQTWLGMFATAELAHQAYCVAAKKMHGEFAKTE
jgi:hypothetical protein